MSEQIKSRISRRQLLQWGVAAGTAGALEGLRLPEALAATAVQATKPKASADAMILIWLPGGIAQTDTWDVKKHTPFEKGMKGAQVLGTCPSIPTAVDGIRFGAGLENMAQIMDRGTLLR